MSDIPLNEMDNDAWLSAHETLEWAHSAIGGPYSSAQETILQRASDGLMQARARTLMTDTRREDDALVPPKFWSCVLERGWEIGDFQARIKTWRIRAYGVQFRRADVVEAFGDHSQVEIETRTASRSGRPRKDFWDDLLIEIAAKLYGGSLAPTRQADIEAAMKDWLAANELDAAESSVRARAGKLWRAIQKA